MNNRCIIYFLGLLLSSSSLLAQPTFIRDSLDTYIVREMQRWRVPGLGLAIIKDGKIVKLRGYGVKHTGVYGASADSVNEHTLFMIGSCSKAFTATALAALEADSVLSLNDKVTKWLPEFRLYETSATQQATIADMLCHRSGLRTFQGDFTYWASNLSRAEVIQKFGLNKPAYPFRTRYGYCNAGFLTAGEILPKASNKAWETVIRERFFTPLGMTRSVALAAEFNGTSNHATGHTLYDDRLLHLPIPAIDNLAPAGSIGSSVHDLVRWAMMQLDTGKFNGTEIFKKQAIMRTWRAETIVSAFRNQLLPTNFGLYGLGWFISDYAGRQLIEHDGGVDGFTTTLCFMQTERLSIIVLTNTDANTLYAALKWRILDAYLQQTPKDYSRVLFDNSAKEQAEEREQRQVLRTKAATKPSPSLGLQSYCGKYLHPVYGEIAVKEQGSALRVEFSHHPAAPAILEPLGDNEFLCTYTNPTLGVQKARFETRQNKVATLTVKVNDFIEYEAYTFEKK
ncbi:MAG: serine hydrolase [Candidatus Kapabacteria bacterium]|jgi:CubicO group peptidase (beta-lactamase class C family)|nr:serine hydrolase [Candidatus Kapabacteria bacterium]